MSGSLTTTPSWRPELTGGLGSASQRRPSFLPARRRGPRRAAPEIPTGGVLARIQFADRPELVDVVAANISLTGMFVRTRQLQSEGSRLHFELIVGDDFASCQGEGEVVWVRRGESFSVLPGGMRIRFLQLDRRSREIVSRVEEPRL